MAAMSGALNVRLEKIGYHVLGERYDLPEPFHIRKVVNIVSFASLLVVASMFLFERAPLVKP